MEATRKNQVNKMLDRPERRKRKKKKPRKLRRRSALSREKKRPMRSWVGTVYVKERDVRIYGRCQEGREEGNWL